MRPFSLDALGKKLASFLGERTDYGKAPESHTLQNQEAYLRVFGLDSLLPYRAYEGRSQLFYNANSCGFVIETYPMVGCTEEMQRELSGLFQHTLNENASLQFLLYADPRIETSLERWAEPLMKRGGVFEDIARRRMDFFKGLVEATKERPLDLSPRTYRCFVSYSEPLTALGPVEEMHLIQTREQIMAALKTLGVPVYVCDAQDLLTFLDGLINFRLSTQPSLKSWNPFDTLATQIPGPETNWHINAEGIDIRDGQYRITTYSMAREPDYWSLHAMGELIGDPYRELLRVKVPFILHYGLTVSDQAKTSMMVQSREDWVEKQSFSKIGKRIPIVKSQAKELSFVREQRAKGERFIESRLSVTLLSPLERFIEQEQILKSLFRSKRWEIQPERYLHLQMFLSCLPMMWGEGMNRDLGYHRRLKTTLTSEAANLLPLQGEWKGNALTGMTFMGRRGQLFTWNPFHGESGNYNVSVVGRSGSGKSVFMQELVTMALGAGAQVFIIDVGRSFEKTVKLLGGTYLEFTPQTALCLNPFSKLSDHVKEEGDKELPQDFLSMLRPIVSLMAAPQDGTSDAENALIEQAILGAWKQKRTDAGINDIATFLRTLQEPLATSLAGKLFPYTTEGSYGRYFNGPATVDLSDDMVVIELEELKERKDLQSVILQVMILQITNQLYLGQRRRATYLVLDEAWDLLRARQAGIFIETAARRFRKYKGSLVVGTQSVHDFYATSGAQAAFDNSDWLCLLSQKKESIEQLKKSDRIVVDPGMEDMLHSLKTEAGAFAEVMIRGYHGYAIGRLVLDPFSSLLYTTKAEEFEAIQTRLARGQTLYEAIEDCAQARGGP